jgi:DNA-binding MarR family transcriptional regulator
LVLAYARLIAAVGVDDGGEVLDDEESGAQPAIVAALEPFVLSFGDFDILNTLRRRRDKPGTNPSDLARSSLITTGAMTARLDRLERAGLIRRAPDPTDRRAVRVHITEEGEQLAEQALHAVIDADNVSSSRSDNAGATQSHQPSNNSSCAPNPTDRDKLAGASGPWPGAHGGRRLIGRNPPALHGQTYQTRLM